MATILVTCSNCNKEFEKSVKEYNQAVKRGYKMYCSKQCVIKKQKNRIMVVCCECNKEIEKRVRFINRNKSGLVFCSKSCKAIHSNRLLYSGENQGKTTYRERALKHYGSKCTICNYDIEGVLEVHHKDGNRDNADINNLDVLCPTHHKEYHVGIRKYD